MLPCEYSAKILHSASSNSAPAVLPVRQTLPRNADALTTKLCTHQGYAKDKTPKMGPSQTLFQSFTQLMFASKELQTQSSRCGDCQQNIICLLNSARLAQQQPAAHLFSVVIDKKKKKNVTAVDSAKTWPAKPSNRHTFIRGVVDLNLRRQRPECSRGGRRRTVV